MFGFKKRLDKAFEVIDDMQGHVFKLREQYAYLTIRPADAPNPHPLWRGLDDRLRETNRKFDSRTDWLRSRYDKLAHEVKEARERLGRRVKDVEKEQAELTDAVVAQNRTIEQILSRLTSIEHEEIERLHTRMRNIEHAQKDVVRVKQFHYAHSAPYGVSSPWEPPKLVEGEKYAGVCRDDDGHWYHLVLVPGIITGTFFQASRWAKGGLPTKRELALLFATQRDTLANDWYWSSEPHDQVAGHRWRQSFETGQQIVSPDLYEGLACAVRRVPINEL